MVCMTLGSLRGAGGTLEIECVRCGALEYRPAAHVEGPDALSLGAVGLRLTCSTCGAKACIADAGRAAEGGTALAHEG
jgi:hypothetical protein